VSELEFDPWFNSKNWTLHIEIFCAECSEVDSNAFKTTIETFDISSETKKFIRSVARVDVSSFIREQQTNYAGHVIRMPIQRKQLMFNDDKYHRVGRVIKVQ